MDNFSKTIAILAGEIGKQACKCIRFGWETRLYNPNEQTNFEAMSSRIDVLYRLLSEKPEKKQAIEAAIEKKTKRLMKYGPETIRAHFGIDALGAYFVCIAEESSEIVDAILKDDPDTLLSEVGDLLAVHEILKNHFDCIVAT